MSFQHFVGSHLQHMSQIHSCSILYNPGTSWVASICTSQGATGSCNDMAAHIHLDYHSHRLLRQGRRALGAISNADRRAGISVPGGVKLSCTGPTSIRRALGSDAHLPLQSIYIRSHSVFTDGLVFQELLRGPVGAIE